MRHPPIPGVSKPLAIPSPCHRDSQLSRKLSGPVRWPERGPLWSAVASCDFILYMCTLRLRSHMSSRHAKPSSKTIITTNILATTKTNSKGDFLATCCVFLLERMPMCRWRCLFAARHSWSSMWTSTPWRRPARRCHPPRRPALPMRRRSTSRRRAPVSLGDRWTNRWIFLGLWLWGMVYDKVRLVC